MFEKYNEKARRALFFARYEASKLGSRVIESEHILLGILREGEETVICFWGTSSERMWLKYRGSSVESGAFC